MTNETMSFIPITKKQALLMMAVPICCMGMLCFALQVIDGCVVKETPETSISQGKWPFACFVDYTGINKLSYI